MNFCEKLAKYFLIILNTLVLICGILLTVYGAYILITEDQGLPRFTEFSVGAFAVAIGAIIIIVSFFGCFGALRESNLLLTIYGVILIILFILQIVLGVYALVFRDKSEDTIENIVKRVFDSETDSNNGEPTNLINKIQHKFECCGVRNGEYWNHLATFPESCFSDPENHSVYKRGCVAAFKDAINKNMVVVGAVAIAFAIIEVLGIVAAFVIKRFNDTYSDNSFGY